MAVIDDVKVLLGNIEGKDSLLNLIVNLTEQRLKTLLEEEHVPYELEYIVTEVAIARFNRIGSEGVSSHSVEGESMSFSDNDFEPFKSDIQVWRGTNNKQNIGKVRFL